MENQGRVHAEEHSSEKEIFKEQFSRVVTYGQLLFVLTTLFDFAGFAACAVSLALVDIKDVDRDDRYFMAVYISAIMRGIVSLVVFIYFMFQDDSEWEAER